MRIYELAKELDINSKELVDLVEQELGIPVKNHMSSLTDLEVIRFKKALSILNNNKKAKTVKAPKVAVIDDEPLVDEKIDLNQAKLKKVDKNLISPVKKPVVQKPAAQKPGAPKPSQPDGEKKDFKKNFNKNKPNVKKKPYPQQQQTVHPEPKPQHKVKNITMED